MLSNADDQRERRTERVRRAAVGARSVGRRTGIQASQRSWNGCDREHDGQPVQPGEIAADDQNELKCNRDQPGDRGDRLRREVEERNAELDDMIDHHAAAVDGRGQPVEVPASAGSASAASRSSSRDTSDRSQHGSPRNLMSPAPNISRNSSHRNNQVITIARFRRAPAEKDREESRLEQKRFPAEAVERLADVDEREVEQPERAPTPRPSPRCRRGWQARQRH